MKETKFCQQASKQYERWLEDAEGDPRLVSSRYPAAEWRTQHHLAPGKDTPLKADVPGHLRKYAV